MVVETFWKSDLHSDQEKGFYQNLVRNNLNSGQKSEYPLCKIIASQKYLPVKLSLNDDEKL